MGAVFESESEVNPYSCQPHTLMSLRRKRIPQQSTAQHSTAQQTCLTPVRMATQNIDRGQRWGREGGEGGIETERKRDGESVRDKWCSFIGERCGETSWKRWRFLVKYKPPIILTVKQLSAYPSSSETQ